MDSRRRKTSSKESLNCGIYLLEIYASKTFEIQIKKFIDRLFSAGYYYYVGSAQKNLRQRLTRHLRKDKIVHWHIDHITTNPATLIKNIFLIKSGKKDLECEIANLLENNIKLDSSYKGFGNSDSNCSSTHLFYSKKKIDHNHLLSLYQSMVRLIPSEIETI
ncbi:MAG: GIY-YIG nuclease family protein [Ignavibacteriales bacterium]|nr:MAG: GIY-YIG nuclease family protein [Ignavibacteriales bacterium]